MFSTLRASTVRRGQRLSFPKVTLQVAAISITLAVATSTPAVADSKDQPDPSGSVVAERLVRNADGSFPSNGTGGYITQTPYTDNPVTRTVGPIYVGESITIARCTATVLDSPSGMLALTAEHCSKNITAGKTVKFSPAAYKKKEPYGGWYIDKAFTPDTTVDGSVPDVAVLVIRPREDGSTIAEATGGGLSIADSPKKGESVNATLLGYPAPKPYNGVTMSACVGDYTYHPGKGRSSISRVTGQSECWVGGGSSGGPYVTKSATGKTPASIVTVLNSSDGSRISGVVPGLMNKAESWANQAYPSHSTAGSTSSGSVIGSLLR